MNVRILSQGSRRANAIVLLELRAELVSPAPLPPVYVVILYVNEEHWARTHSNEQDARELYDQALRDFITPEVDGP